MVAAYKIYIFYGATLYTISSLCIDQVVSISPENEIFLDFNLSLKNITRFDLKYNLPHKMIIIDLNQIHKISYFSVLKRT